MTPKGWKVVTAALSVLVVILVVVAAYMGSIAGMGQISTLADNSHISLTQLSSSAVSLQVRYSGYLVVKYNSTSAVALVVKYTYAGTVFTSTSLGTQGRINMAVLPSAVTLTFTSTFSAADIHYSVYEQY